MSGVADGEEGVTRSHETGEKHGNTVQVVLPEEFDLPDPDPLPEGFIPAPDKLVASLFPGSAPGTYIPEDRPTTCVMSEVAIELTSRVMSGGVDLAQVRQESVLGPRSCKSGFWKHPAQKTLADEN